ncbi:MAG TPA: fused MFS/spermidine synthase, partial [Syntrophales bacterium]|nr:fused MFS/spermidine synthase [Syntrophales bacterium]
PVIPDRIVYGPKYLMFLLIGYGVCGIAALVYEIAWTRALSLLIGSSVYAFSMILTAFVLGIAIGSMVYARFVDRILDPMRALAIIQVAIGLSALLVAPLIGNLPFLVTGWISHFSASFWQLQTIEFVMILLIMLLPTTLMGAAFPLVSRLFIQRSETAGTSMGTLYAFNTIGNIIGAFVGGFVLIPLLGIENTLFVAVMINILMGSSFLALSHSLANTSKGLAVGASIAAGVIGFILIPSWNISGISFGPFYEAVRLPKSIARSPEELKAIAAQRKILFHKEGVSTTVTVKQFPDKSLALYINGKPDASSVEDLPSQELVAHIPLLTHPDPRSALVIGLASGISLGSASRHPLERIDCVEISPAMVEASHYFDAYNYRPLDDPRVNLIIGDGRNHLALTEKIYDVIISEPSNPYFAGEADLFTREYYQLCRDRLTDHGVACAWVQAYMIDKESFRSIVRSFQSVFPEMILWKTAKGDCMMLGSKVPLKVDYHELDRRIRHKGVAEDLARIDIRTAADFLAHMVMGKKNVETFVSGAIVHTDYNALVEFAAPKAVTGESYQWPLIEAMERYREADLSFLTASAVDAGTVVGVKAEVTRFIEARGHVYQAYFFNNRGETAKMAGELRKAAALNPNDKLLKEAFDFMRKQAFDLAESGRTDSAVALYREMTGIFPGDAKVHYNLATLLKRSGDMDEALKHYREAVRYKPDYVIARFNLAAIAERKGLFEEAESEYRHALQTEPDCVPVINNLARLLAFHPNPGMRNVTEALRLAERGCKLTGYKDPVLLDTLAEIYAASGRWNEAGSVARQGLDIAISKGDRNLADRLRKRIEFFQQHQ